MATKETDQEIFTNKSGFLDRISKAVDSFSGDERWNTFKIQNKCHKDEQFLKILLDCYQNILHLTTGMDSVQRTQGSRDPSDQSDSASNRRCLHSTNLPAYMLMMYVTLEQEHAIRSVYEQNGWTYEGEGFISKKSLSAAFPQPRRSPEKVENFSPLKTKHTISSDNTEIETARPSTEVVDLSMDRVSAQRCDGKNLQEENSDEQNVLSHESSIKREEADKEPSFHLSSFENRTGLSSPIESSEVHVEANVTLEEERLSKRHIDSPTGVCKRTGMYVGSHYPSNFVPSSDFSNFVSSQSTCISPMKSIRSKLLSPDKEKLRCAWNKRHSSDLIGGTRDNRKVRRISERGENEISPNRSQDLAVEAVFSSQGLLGEGGVPPAGFPMTLPVVTEDGEGAMIQVSAIKEEPKDVDEDIGEVERCLSERRLVFPEGFSNLGTVNPALRISSRHQTVARESVPDSELDTQHGPADEQLHLDGVRTLQDPSQMLLSPGVTYDCDICEKSYKSMWGLYRHKRQHTGLLFHCDICKRTFVERFRWKAHMNRHVVAPPFLNSSPLRTYNEPGHHSLE